MKISNIEVIQFDLEGTKISDSKRMPWRPIICRVNTDEGISGLGEVGLAYGNGGTGGYGMTKDLAEIVLGMNPMNIEEIWEIMLKKTFWGQGGGTVVSAGMSAIDIALWDIKGKALDVPVYELFGGKTRDNIRCYASQIQLGWSHTAENLIEPEEYAEAAVRAVEEGYDCIKVDPLSFDTDGLMGWSLTKKLSKEQMWYGFNRLKAIRDAVGPEIDMIVELHSLTDTTTAIQFGRAIEDLDVYYYEEPVMPLNPKMMKEVKDNVKIPIASGERIYTRWGYRPFFEMRALDVIQPDFCNCGGLSEGKKICDMAHVYDISVQGHVCGSPVSTAAALQIEAAIPNFIIHEHHRNALLEQNIALCKYDYQPVNGRYKVPDLPGIGQELNEDALQKAVLRATIK